MDKKTITILVLAGIIIAIALFFSFSYVRTVNYSSGYSRGVSTGIESVVAQQTQTGEMFYINQGNITKTSITELCTRMIQNSQAQTQNQKSGVTK